MPAGTLTLTGPVFQPDAESIVSTWSGQTTKYLTLDIFTIENSRNQTPWLPVLTVIVSVRQRLQSESPMNSLRGIRGDNVYDIMVFAKSVFTFLRDGT